MPDVELIKLTKEHRQAILENNNFLKNYYDNWGSRVYAFINNPNDILINLYQKDDRIRYSKYNLSWPLLNRIRWDGAKIKSLSSIMAKKLHLSSSSFVTLCLPYLLFCIKNETLELELEETFGAIIDKEIELLQ